MVASTCLSPSFYPTATAATHNFFLISGNSSGSGRFPRRMSGTRIRLQNNITNTK
jgi:hypothetical protein